MGLTGIVTLAVVAGIAAAAGALISRVLIRRRSVACAEAEARTIRDTNAEPSGTRGRVTTANATKAPQAELELATLSPIEPEEVPLPAAAIRISNGDVHIADIVPFSENPLGWTATNDTRLGFALESMVRGAPLTALGLQQAAGGVYHLKLTAEASAHLANGSWKFMEASGGGFRLNLVDAAGTVRGQGAMVPAQAAAGAALAIWQVLAIITAQKFLADIDRKLAALETGVRDVRATLEENRRGTLIGNLAYLRQIASALARNTIMEDDAKLFLGQLEHIERECQQVEAASAATVNRVAEDFMRLPLTKTKHFKEDVQKTLKSMDGFAVAAQTRILALQVRAVACQLRAALPINAETTLLRAQEVIKSLKEANAARMEFFDKVHQRSWDLKGSWTFDSTDKHAQALVRCRNNELSTALRGATDSIGEATSWIEAEMGRRLQSRADPVELLLSADGAGRVIEVRQRIQCTVK